MSVESPRIEDPTTTIENASLSPESWRVEWAVLIALMVAFALIYLAYYPPLPGIEDEIGFVNQTLVWSRGALSAEGAGYKDLADFMELDGRHVAARHPGRSLVALPFLWLGGVHAIFLSGLVLHLFLTAAGAHLFVRMGRSPLWAVLLLIHPTLALYSRTVMADATAGTALLVAAIGVLSSSRWAGLGAGAAVGVAAAMRYHAVLALPIVAGSFLIQRGRPRAMRDALLCVVGASIVGALIACYNLKVYGTVTEPFTGRRGYFSADFLIPHLIFYTTALLVVWPAMLIAPIVDRSPLRWLIRGVCALFLGFLTLYYFHDRGSSWIETAVVGQRLLQVALPLWTVSYAGMLDDWVAQPLRRILGNRVWQGLVGLACFGALLPIFVMFRQHQHHLNTLLEARNAIVEKVPEGSLILYEGAFLKLVGVPTEVPTYRTRPLTFEEKPTEDPQKLAAELDREQKTWYLAILRKAPVGRISSYAKKFMTENEMELVTTQSPILQLHLKRPKNDRIRQTPDPTR